MTLVALSREMAQAAPGGADAPSFEGSCETRVGVTPEIAREMEILYTRCVRDPLSSDFRDGGVIYPRSAEWLQNLLSSPGGELALARGPRGELRGFCVFFTDPTELHPIVGDFSRFSELGMVGGIFIIMVDPDCRRQGIGRTLYTKALEVCEERGLDLFGAELVSAPVLNEASMALHRSLGFVNTGHASVEELETEAAVAAGSAPGGAQTVTYAQLVKAVQPGKMLVPAEDECGFKIVDRSLDLPALAE
jgi:ribosomal protein S18 acetylase RimI-like enzyme